MKDRSLLAKQRSSHYLLDKDKYPGYETCRPSDPPLGGICHALKTPENAIHFFDQRKLELDTDDGIKILSETKSRVVYGKISDASVKTTLMIKDNEVYELGDFL